MTPRAPSPHRRRYLYHGSQVLVSRLDPQVARGIGPASDTLFAVYASPEKSYAAAFALPFVPDPSGDLTWSLRYANRAPRIVMRAGALDLRRVGYLYRVPADAFVRIDDLQWVAHRPVVPHDHEVVDPANYLHWFESPPSIARPKWPTTSGIDFDRLWTHVCSQSVNPRSWLHGPAHWRRVERNGLLLAARTGVDGDIVRMFALFHDCCRRHDGTDRGHGARGAELAARLRGVLFDLPDDAFELLQAACTWHTDRLHHRDPTIGTCWDADRLDLGRVGVTPEARFMSTGAGRALANDLLQHQALSHARTAGGRRAANWLDTYGAC